MKLKSNSGRIVVKGLGITLTQNSTEAEIARALKHQPALSQFIDGAKQSSNAETK